MNEQTRVVQVASVTRGRHTSKEEMSKNNLKNKDIQEALVLGFNNVYTYQENLMLDDTIIQNSDFTKVYVNLYKKFRNTIVQSQDIIIPVYHTIKSVKFINWKTKRENYIYADDVIIVKADKEKVRPQFLFEILNILLKDYDDKGRMMCETVENLQFLLPTLKKQDEVLNQIKKSNLQQIKLDEQLKSLIKV